MKKIAVIGSLNMDLTIRSERVPSIGETILGGDFAMTPGGKGANQAVAAARLGGKVSMIGCVGRDSFGDQLVHHLIAENIDVLHVRVAEKCASGVAMIVVSKKDNFIIVDPGANQQLRPTMIEESEEVIRTSHIALIQQEIPCESVQRAIDTAWENQVKIILNPAPARQLPDELLSRIDVLTPNQSECEIMTGIPVGTVEDASQAIRFLQNKGVRTVLITMGENGAVYNSGDRIVHKMAYAVEAVDTTAAGDCFSAAVAVALSEGKSIDAAVDFANAAAALTVMKRGAQSSLPAKRDVENFLRSK